MYRSVAGRRLELAPTMGRLGREYERFAALLDDLRAAALPMRTACW
ncbi:hypothetical protein [Streptomyces sp. SID3343]|nr:hypothetical protein [Streptomyces sp. SID3343]MYW03993.1 hypothetical protein [Streptomyces sp. SID3343]